MSTNKAKRTKAGQRRADSGLSAGERRRLIEDATTRAARRAERNLKDRDAQWSSGETVMQGLVLCKLAEIRRERGLSQRAVAERAGIPQSHVSKIERNPERCTLRVLQRVAKALDVPMRDLF